MSNHLEAPKKVDNRRATALENLRKGREKLQELKKAGLIKAGRKPKKDIKIKESDSDSDIDDSDSEEDSESSEDEYLLKRKKPLKQKGKGKKDKAPKMSKIKNELSEMKNLIFQMNQAKLAESQKPKEKVIINMAPTSAVQPPKVSNDDLLRKAMFGF